MVDVNVILSVSVTAFMKEDTTMITDLYLPHGSLEIETTPIRLQNTAKEISEEEFFKESVTLPPTAPVFGRIIDTDCRISELNHSASKTEGIAEVTFMYLSPSSAAINTYTARLPISHAFAAQSVSNARCSVKHTGYAITGDNAIDIRISVIFEATLTENEEVYVISNCLEKEYIAPKCNSVTVSFVNKGDTLWSIAKKHNIALSHLASANAIDENAALTVGSKLIIPR
jgi:LysM repeat protein